MPQQVYPHIYCIRIPLPNNPLKELNSYVVVAPNRNLIVDTGFNQPECEEALFGGLQELGVDLTSTDVLLTHLHADHTGLARKLEKQGARILAGATERVTILSSSDSSSWTRVTAMIKKYGLEKYNVPLEKLPGYRYRPEELDAVYPLTEGDELTYGDFTFAVVDSPGHTPGHIGLYEKKKGLLFCGDHILASITPNITLWSYDLDSLAQYLASLAKVREMNIRTLFTAHRAAVADPTARIDQLICHHQQRLQEILQILAGGEGSAADVAAQMKWEIRAKDWEEFPVAQKVFATGEAAAHLEYLFHAGQIQRTTADGVMYYSLP